MLEMLDAETNSEFQLAIKLVIRTIKKNIINNINNT
jgi:hypothetical protein